MIDLLAPRLFVIFLGGVLALCLFLWGWSNLYDNRPLRGAALLGVGVLAGLGGLAFAALAPMQ